MPARSTFAFLSLILGLAALGCADDSTACGDGANCAAGGSGGSGGSGATGGEGAGVEHADLFACGLAYDCPTISMHIGPEPASALECAGQLVHSGTPGVLNTIFVPGPHFYQDDALWILRGDGTALVQTRFRSCSDDCPDPVTSLPWARSPHMICDVSLGATTEQACDDDATEGCVWAQFSPDPESCEIVDDVSCAEAAALLE